MDALSVGVTWKTMFSNTTVKCTFKIGEFETFVIPYIHIYIPIGAMMDA